MVGYLDTEEYKHKRREVINSGIKATMWGFAASGLIFAAINVFTAGSGFVALGAVLAVAGVGALIKSYYAGTDARAQDDDLRARISAERMKETMQSMGLSKEEPAALAAATAYAMEEQASHVERLRQQKRGAAGRAM